MKGLSTFKLGFAPGTLLVKLMASFLSVILLLAAFNVFSYLYLRNKLYDEIVRYNELGIKQTVESYENHFRMTQNMILSLTQSDRWIANIGILSNVESNRRYDKMNEVKTDLAELYTNPFLHVENFILYFKQAGYVLEKEGTSSASDMFASYYASDAYPPSYWDGLSTDNYLMRILPAAVFTEESMGNVRSLGLQLPLVIKAAPYEDVYCIVMMDPRKLYSAYANTGEPFYILDPEGRTLFSSHGDTAVRSPSSFEDGKRHEQSGGNYYFYEQGADTGFTYVRVAPIKSITAEMMKLNILLVTLLVVAVLVSIVGAALFSLRLNHPLKRIVAMLERKQELPLPASSIKEFAIIGDRMSSIMDDNEQIRKDLLQKNSLVRQYAYTNKVKNIPMNLHLTELEDAVQLNEPYAAVLYEIGFKNTDSEYEQEIQLLRKLVHGLFSSLGEEPVTLQIEHNQLMSLLFQPGSQSEVLRILHTLKELLGAEDYLCLTIAVSPVYPEDTPVTLAYEQLLQLLKEKRLTGETQIIAEPRSSGNRALPMKVTQREELQARLLSGSEEAVFEWVDRHLEQLAKKDAPAADFQAYARGVAEQVEKALAKLNVPDSSGDAGVKPADPSGFDRFYSAEQYRGWFRERIRPALSAIRARTETKDPITTFVTEYLDGHLGEDINLDLVADKLNITPGYLSSYFKEKTGTNFSDYLNDLRIGRAKELLMNLELRIQDVASAVGYHNVNSFIRMFKRYSGITPGEYRKRNVGGSA
ncbi:helix-turn-helix domain-containing protein [Paenibacillus soyae]|uniref:AraC family transcriptional regulator n=1 Tax=Paenibacillus soyae TaxID=2969249 RepID=A0A9X2SBR2_9BACL|nr:helix-turn-helix domain-containing protein [Paenibacillus soyae]MCR2805237.1 AraC family transcriptional regulator [Paenibacillus soyae]